MQAHPRTINLRLVQTIAEHGSKTFCAMDLCDYDVVTLNYKDLLIYYFKLERNAIYLFDCTLEL